MIKGILQIILQVYLGIDFYIVIMSIFVCKSNYLDNIISIPWN